MPEIHLIPILGRKTDVPANDPSMLQPLGENVFASHDVAGLNYDISRQRNVCTKSEGFERWDASATDQATKCLGLYMIDGSSQRDYVFFDNGRFYVYDSSLQAYEAKLNFDAGTDEFAVGETVTDGTTSATAVILSVTVSSGAWATNDAAGYLVIHTIDGNFGNNNAITSTSGAATVDGDLTTVTFATDNKDLYSMIQVGDDLVWADRGETTPYKWGNGDDNPSKLIDPSGGSGYTEYKFRILMYFMRRIVGLYSDQTNGDIDIRWTGALPDLSGDVEFPAANQLYVPNDDAIVGASTMGTDRAYIYSKNSIHQLVYYPDYTTPFRAFTIVPDHGAVNHHCIVSAHNQHFVFNRDFGFCMYDGGPQFPTGRPISDNIESDVAAIDPEYYDLIVGTYVPITQKIVWTVPAGYSTTPNQLWFYDLRNGQWSFEEKTMRYVDTWRLYSTYTWSNMIADYGDGWGYVQSNAWGQFVSSNQRLTYANTDGKLYYQSGESMPSGFSQIDGYRVEPIVDFGDVYRKDVLEEIWMEIVDSGDFNIDIYHRGGDTVAEVIAASWTKLGTISADSPDVPALRDFAKSARLHQIKWGTTSNDQKFGVNRITLKWEPQSRN